MQNVKWFHFIVLVALFFTIAPVQAAPDSGPTFVAPDDKATVGIRMSKTTTLAQSITPVWAADYGSFIWLELPVSQLPLPVVGDETYQVFELALGIHDFHFDPLLGEPVLPPHLRAESNAGPGLHLVQFHGPVADAWLQDLRTAGLLPLQYYPQNAYLVWGEMQALEAVASAPYVRWTGVFQTAYKLNPALTKLAESMESTRLIENVALTFYNDGSIETTLKALENIGGQYVQHFAAQPDGAFQTVILKLPAGRLAEAAGLPTAWAMDFSSPQPGLDDEVSNQINVGNYTGGVPFTGYQSWLTAKGVDGVGVIFADVDTGMDTNNNATAHQDIRGRLAAFVSYPGSPSTDTDGHGTHTGGIIAGNGALGITDPNGFLYGQGVAPGAQLVVQNALLGSSWPPSGGWQVLSRDSVLNNAVGSSNSWYTGASGAQGYSAAARTHDFMVRDANFDTATVAEPLIMVFSAGNSGSGASTITEPKEAKNLIVVGASENYRPDNPLGSGCGASSNIENVVSFSSRGPALDGRLLPNIVAPGSDIASLRSYTGSYSGCGQVVVGQPDYVYMSGTSMACPMVSGGAALITQWWRGLMSGSDPSPAMAKALLINGATPMSSSSIPNNNQGWGRMNLDNVIAPGVFSDYIDQSITFGSTGENWQHLYTIASSSQPVKVSLVWSDAAGAIGANPALVNDLDLVVTVGGDTYLGNVFSGGWSATGGTADSLNNIENVFLPAGATGMVQVTVNAVNVAGDGVPYNADTTDQDFALVIYNVAPPEGLGWLDGTISDANTLAPVAGAAIQATSATPSHTSSTASAVDGAYHMALISDTYTMTVSAYGYQPAQISSVGVISGVTTTQNVSLVPAPSYILSGTVTDANTGWALYASVEIIPDGYPAQTVWTNPWTGAYNVTLVGNYTHTLNVEPWDGIAGYVPQSREVNLTGDAVENFALEVDDVACAAPGYTSPGGFSEGFEDAAFPPTGWTAYNVDNDGGGTQWARSTTRFHSGTASALHTYDAGAPAEDGWLRLPQLTLGATPELRFWENVDWASYYGKHSLWACTTACDTPPTNYTEVTEYSSPAEDTWVERVTALSAYAGQTVYLAFRYEGEDADNWYIDDVVIAAPCTAPTGGLLVGSVYDFNTNGHLTGAQVHNSLGDTATAQATPGSPTLSEALYALYAPSGSQTFTATMPGYEDSVVSSYLVQDGVTQGQDFFMHAGYPQVTPGALHVTVGAGLSTTRQLVVSNANASIPFDFEFKERNGGFTPELAAEDVLVVRRDTAAAGAMETALTTLGYTFLGVTTAEFQAMAVNDLLEYPAIFYAGMADGSTSSGTDHDLLVGYLDGGGKLYISDNDLGYYHRTTDPTGFYGTYLQSDWVLDNYGDGPITGMDFMAGLNPDTTADPYPDGFTVGAEGVKLFNAPTDDAAGVAVERNGYQAIYTSFDFDDIASADDEVELIRRVTDFFGLGDVPWLATDPVTGTVAASGQVVVDVTFDSAVASAVGDYYATLTLSNDSPYEAPTIPVTMTVVTPNLYVSTGSGDWDDLGSWSGSPTRLPTAADNVTIAAGTEITVDNASECFNLTVETGARLNIADTLYVYGAITNQGQLHQEAPVDGSGTVDFLMLDDGMGNVKFYGITLEAAGVNLGNTSVDIYGQGIEGTGNLSQTVETWFDITPEYPVVAPTVVPITFWYPNSALNGNVPSTANVYHYAGSGNWEALNKLANGTDGAWEWITAEATGFSPFVIKSPAAPTAVIPHGLAASANLYGIVAIGLALGAVLLLHKRALARAQLRLP